MPDDEYEDILKLKQELESLKRGKRDQPSLQESMEQLSNSINSLIRMFEEAGKEIKVEEAEEHFISARLDPILDKLDEITDQNHKIAEGIIALADMIKEMKEQKMEMPKPRPFRSSFPEEPFGGPPLEPLPPLPPLRPGPGMGPPPPTERRPFFRR